MQVSENIAGTFFEFNLGVFAGDGNVIDENVVLFGPPNVDDAFFQVELLNLCVFQLQDEFDHCVLLSPITL
jgi:hypothetical protein